MNFRRTPFPSFDFLTKTASPDHYKRQNTSLQSSPEVIASFGTYGPLFARLVSDHRLAEPMFATTLQRDSIDIGGNVGQLSIGELPAGIQSNSLTWVPLRAYTPQEGGLPPSSDAPHEVCTSALSNSAFELTRRVRYTRWCGKSPLTTCTLIMPSLRGRSYPLRQSLCQRSSTRYAAPAHSAAPCRADRTSRRATRSCGARRT